MLIPLAFRIPHLSGAVFTVVLFLNQPHNVMRYENTCFLDNAPWQEMNFSSSDTLADGRER